MNRHPIIFNADEISAIKEGKKTQTRCPVSYRPDIHLFDCLAGHADEEDGNGEDLGQKIEAKGIRVWCAEYPEEGSEVIESHFGLPGDALKVWMRLKAIDRGAGEAGKKYKPTDLLLEITNVRIDRLQEISDNDCVAEGFSLPYPYTQQLSAAHGTYQTFWDITHKKEDSWDKNPWVWVIEFKKI